MNEADDDLQRFITDCEWKTRKILRESNKRMKDNARSLAAKERLENLKHNGTPTKPNGLAKKAGTPLAKSKRLNISSPLRSSSPAIKKPSSTPVKEWKGRDKIIHDAYETLKSLPSDKKSLKATAPTGSQHAENTRIGIHSSLSASPFCGAKGNSDGATKSKHKGTCAGANSSSSDANASAGNGEPAMVTRRTIERDFYIMSKKRSNPPSKRRQQKSEPLPELKTSVLRKKYRCDERIMKAKRKRAERLYEKLQRLKMPSDDDSVDGGEASDSDSLASSSDAEEYSHALYDLVEKHIDYENARVLKRTNKMLAKTTFKPNVKEFWVHLQHGNEDTAIRGQVESVPLSIATKDLYDPGEVDIGERADDPLPSIIDQGPVSRYICPYEKPVYEKQQLVVNEPLMVPSSINQALPLTVSISMLRHSNPEPVQAPSSIWVYEIYDPSNGSMIKFNLSEEGFDSLNKALQMSTHNQQQNNPSERIVHHQIVLSGDGGCTFGVLVSADNSEVTCKLFRSTGHNADRDGLDGLCVDGNLIATLQACEVLQVLKKIIIYSAFDPEFWLSDSNGAAVWMPLIDILQGGTATGDANLMTATTKAHDSMHLLRNVATGGGVARIIDMMQAEPSTDPILANNDKECPPLSMRISGCSPYLSTVCPGHAPVGKRGVWRFVEPGVEEDTDFSVWPALEDVKYPDSLDRSQATGYFHYRNLGAQKGNYITVLSSLAFESPILSPYCFARDKGYVSPPFSEHEPVTGIIPYVHLPGTNLMETPVESRLDTMLPPPVVVLDPGASEVDWQDAPRNADGQVYHLRELDQLDGDGFRVTTWANRVEYDDSISSMVYGISESAASPNHPVASPLLSHTSREACTQSLIRERTSSDYHYIAESDGEGTLNEPYLFSTHMSAYKSVFVSRTSISSYREQERFLYATKEAERKKLELALKMKAAEELVEERLRERIARIEQSVKCPGDLESTGDRSLAIEMPSADLSEPPTPKDKIPCDVELVPPSDQSLDDSDGNELEQLANLLLKNARFLKAVARKLNISEDQVAQIDASDNEGATANASSGDHCDAEEPSTAMAERLERVALHQPSTATPPLPSPEPKSLPKLKLNCQRYRDIHHASSRGDGWKRLPRSETIIGDFSLTKRNVQRGVGGPKFKKLEDGRNFVAVNAVQELRHETDSKQFVVEPQSLFISDLTTERLQLAKTYRQQKKTKESVLSLSQQRSLNEILQIPVSDTPKEANRATGDIETNIDDGDGGESDNQSLAEEVRPSDHVSRAILAVKNHNLADLEEVLDTQGLAVETRDHHGNTLFILACQQGSKKLAKFLLRRGADMNAQNNGGNAALHYLYEYKHVSLAEYLIRKGADDSIKNKEGLTVYEGTTLHSQIG